MWVIKHNTTGDDNDDDDDDDDDAYYYCCYYYYCDTINITLMVISYVLGVKHIKHT